MLKFPFLIQIRVHNLIHMKKFPKSKGEYIFFLFLISGSGIEELRIQETWNWDVRIQSQNKNEIESLEFRGG